MGETYGKIYELFEPIFKWIQKYYPSGAFFVVDSDAAKLYCGNPELLVASERLKEPIKIESLNEEERNVVLEWLKPKDGE